MNPDPFAGFDFNEIKIKKKMKPESETNKDKMNNQDFNMMHEGGALKTHRVAEMNVIKVYNDIIEKTTKDPNLFNFIRSLVINKKQQLVSKSISKIIRLKRISIRKRSGTTSKTRTSLRRNTV